MQNRLSDITRLFIIFAIAMSPISCEKDETKMPEIRNFELGYENSKTGYIGSDIHIEAEIFAENGINLINIEIHHEGDHKKSIIIANGDHHHGWEVDKTWDNFSGLKNTLFHEHIKIPLEAEPGEYHFHFKVIDLEGYTAEIEEDLEIREPEVSESPVITISQAPQTGETFSNDQVISISGTVTHSLGVRGLYIGLVRSDTGYTDAQVN